MPEKEKIGILIEYQIEPEGKYWKVTLKFKYWPGPLFNSSGNDFFTHIYKEAKATEPFSKTYHKYLQDMLLKKVSITVDTKTNRLIRWRALYPIR